MTDAVLHHPIIQTLLVLWVVVLLDAIWRWPEAWHPLTLLRHLAEALGKKVLPKASEPAAQHLISGSLAGLILILPVAVLLALLVYMAEYPVFFEAIIVFSVLDFGAVRHRYNQVVRAIGEEKKLLAREAVSQIVARDCQSLSDIGIAKAAMESLLLRFFYQFAAVLLWYVIAGPIAALVYRLTLTLSWQWHWRRPGYHRFAVPMRKLSRLLNGPPLFITALLMALVTHPLAAVKALRSSPGRDRTSRLLALFGGGQGIRIGGPAIYNGTKIRYPRVGGHREVRYSDMVYCRRAITRCSLLLLALITLILLAIWRATASQGSWPL